MKRIGAAVAASLCMIASAIAQSRTEPAARPPAAGAPAFAALAKPIVLNELPDVAECHDILDQEILDYVNAAPDDPGKIFEQWRREHRNMIEASPVVECESKLWNALHRKAGLFNRATVPSGTEGLGLRPMDTAAQLVFRTLAASIGSNVDPAGGVSKYQGEVQIAVNPNNPLQLVGGANSFYRDPDPGCQSPTGGSAKTFGTQALYSSNDGGVTWTYRCAPWPTSLTGGVNGAQAWFGSDPAMAWDSQGRAYAVYMLISQTNGGSAGAAIVTSRSSDAGNSWTYLGTIVNHINSTSLFDDKEFVAVDNSPGPASTLSHPGRIYVIWDENNVERVAYSDNGSTWTTVVLPSPSFGQYDIGGDVKVAPDGTVYVIWNRLIYSGNTQTSEATVLSKSADGGVNWSTPVTVATHGLLSFGTNNTPPAQENRGTNAFGSLSLDTNAASAYFGRLYVAFPDFPSGVSSGTDTNIYVVSSSNGGTSWPTPVKVNDDVGTATQFFPWLAVDPTDGSVNVSWYDTRLDTTNNRKTQLFYARSVNGGISFEPNLLVTDNGGTVWINAVNYSDENTTDNASRNANQYGDYSGIVANNRQVHPLWTDSRQFYPISGDARVEDAASAAIVNCSAPTAIPAPSAGVGSTCGTPSVIVSWSAPAGWGTNATGGTYFVYRSTTATFPTGSSPIASSLTSTAYTDTTGVGGTTYYYFVSAKNNCPGTALTPMSTNSPASAGIPFPAAATPPTATVSGNATICAGSSTTISATLTGTAPWIVTWSDGVTQSNIPSSPATRSVSPSSTITYTVTAVSDANCNGTASGSALVTVNATPPTPTISASGPTSFCLGGSVTLTSSSATGNQWFKDSTPISGETSPSYSATASGSYTVQVTNGSGCSATSAATTVTASPVPPTPTINTSGSTTFCAGRSVTLTSSSTTGNQWFKDNVLISGATSQSYSATVSGSYTVQVTSGGCSATSSPTIVTVNPNPAKPTISASGPTTFCAGGSVTLTSSSTSGNQWLKESVPISNATSQSYNATASGNYTVRVTNANGCSATSVPTTVTVNANPPTPLISTSGPTTFCAGGSVTLTSSSAAGNQWFKDNILIGGAASQSYAATASGNYTVQVTSSNGCNATSAPTTVTVNANPPTPTINAGGPTTFCPGGSVTLTSSSATGNQWFRNGIALSGETNPSYVATTSGSYTVQVTNASGCSATSAPTTVTADATPTPLNVVATAVGTSQVTLSWSAAAGADHYEVTRSSGGGAPATIASPVSNSFIDSNVTPGTTYVYRVRTIDACGQSPSSSPDIATTIVFTDDPLVAGSTVIKAVHLTELRTAVNAVRAAGALGPFSFTDPNPAGVVIKAIHVQELRAALDEARSAIGLSPATYSSALVAGSTPVRAVDITEIRNGVK